MKKFIIPVLMGLLGIFLFASTPNFPADIRNTTFMAALFLLFSAMILFMTHDKSPYIKKIMLWLVCLFTIGTGPVLLGSSPAWLLVAFLGFPLTILWMIYFRHPPHLWKFVWLYRRKTPSEASHYMNEWIRTHPSDWRVYIMRSHAHLNRGQIAEAERDSRMAIKLNPEYHEGYNQLGRCQLIMGEYEEAKQAFESAQKRRSNAQYLANLGTAYYMLGDYPAAARVLTQAARQPLDYPLFTMAANYYLGCSLENMGENEKAREAFKTMKHYAADIDQYIAQINESPEFPGTVATRTHFMDIKRRLNS